MIRAITHLNESLLSRIESYNKGFSNNYPHEALILCGDIAKDMNIIDVHSGHERQTYALFSNIIKNTFLKPFADDISCHLNTYFFGTDPIWHVLSYLPPSRKIFWGKSQTGFNALSYVSKFFNEIAHTSKNNWIQDQFISLRKLGLKTASHAIKFIETNNLTKINLSDVKNFTSEDFQNLAKIISPDTTMINLSCTHATDADIIPLVKGFSNLKMIDLFNTNITDEGLKIIAQSNPNLSLFKLASRAITDEGINYIATHCKHLTKIDLSYASATADLSLVALGKNCPKLTNIDFRYVEVTNQGSIALAKNLHQLKNICFAETNLSNQAAIKFIKNNSCLTKVNFGYTNVNGNDIINALKNHINLKHLMLSETGINTISFEIIQESFPNITKLHISDFSITYKQLVALAIALPSLKEYCFNLDLLKDEEHDQFSYDFPNCEWFG